MKKLTVTLAAVTLVGMTASLASAQCAFNEPGKAKGLKSSMVRSYASCPGITFAAPNTSTNAGVPGCTPPFAHSEFQFSAKGSCSIKTGHKLEDPCKSGTNIPCSNLALQAKCKGIVKSDGVSPITDDDFPPSAVGWNLNTVARATFNDNSSGDMTVIDFPAQFNFPPGKKGKLKLKSDTNALLNDLFGPGSELPGCTAVQLISIAIADPSGNIFAVMGSSTR